MTDTRADYRQEPRHTNASPIAAARIRAGLTQAELAQRIGTTQQAVARWESGAVSPRIDKLKAISAALDTPLAALV